MPKFKAELILEDDWEVEIFGEMIKDAICSALVNQTTWLTKKDDPMQDHMLRFYKEKVKIFEDMRDRFNYTKLD